ncbi:unnamed protein product, partial [Linum tenue]
RTNHVGCGKKSGPPSSLATSVADSFPICSTNHAVSPATFPPPQYVQEQKLSRVSVL